MKKKKEKKEKGRRRKGTIKVNTKTPISLRRDRGIVVRGENREKRITGGNHERELQDDDDDGDVNHSNQKRERERKEREERSTISARGRLILERGGRD